MLSLYRKTAASRLFARFQSTATPSISPVLLQRARNIAAEHAKLSAQNAENYDIGTAKKIGELSSVTAALAEWDTAQNVIGILSRMKSRILTAPFAVHQ